MTTQEKKDMIMKLISELGREGIGVEVHHEFAYVMSGEKTCIHHITFKETFKA